MKTITTQQETVITRTSYVCDVEGCAFTTDNSRIAKAHFANNHSFVETRKIGNDEWLRFETDENYRIFHEDAGNDHYARKYYKHEWDGPSWYRVKRWLDGRGEYELERAVSLRRWEEDWKEEIRDLIVELRAVRPLKEKR